MSEIIQEGEHAQLFEESLRLAKLLRAGVKLTSEQWSILRNGMATAEAYAKEGSNGTSKPVS